MTSLSSSRARGASLPLRLFPLPLPLPRTRPLAMQLNFEPTWPSPGLYAVFQSCQSDRVLISQSRPGKKSCTHHDSSCFVAAHLPAIATWPTLTLPNPNSGAPLVSGACHPRRDRDARRPAPSPETSTISRDLHRQGTRAVQNVAPPLAPSLPPQTPRRPTHRAPPPPTHTGNVGVMTNTSTQPIGNTLIEFDTPPTLTHAAESP